MGFVECIDLDDEYDDALADGRGSSVISRPIDTSSREAPLDRRQSPLCRDARHAASVIMDVGEYR